jgi:putative transcriptional regulator
MEKLARIIAGEIVTSADPGGTMKKWREVFEITQGELAESMHVSPSTISDYESNRRESPGIKVVKRFIDTIIRIDRERGYPVIQKLGIQGQDQKTSGFEVHDFSTILNGVDFVKLLEASVVTNEEIIEKKKVYGYTLLDSLKIITDFQYTDFQRLYGSISERAFIFMHVTTGRSPMIAVKLAPIKPSLVVVHGLKKKDLDPLAVKIAEKEKIPLLLTEMDVPKLKETLAKY